MTKIMKDKIRVFGVIRDTSEEARRFVGKKKTKFKIYVPDDLERFEKEMRTYSDETQVYVYHEDKIVLKKSGDIAGEDYKAIIKILKQLTTG
ncbi:MAG: hypothetical protein GY765_32155 [bacterium]|nr:hypothetical protein [bacterium]